MTQTARPSRAVFLRARNPSRGEDGMRRGLQVLTLLAASGAAFGGELPIFDAHLHYSHDAWESLPAKEAVALLRKAGVRGGLVSSSNDDGTQRLLAEAPDLIIPELRPYRTRSDISTWVRDESI